MEAVIFYTLSKAKNIQGQNGHNREPKLILESY